MPLQILQQTYSTELDQVEIGNKIIAEMWLVALFRLFLKCHLQSLNEKKDKLCFFSEFELKEKALI